MKKFKCTRVQSKLKGSFVIPMKSGFLEDDRVVMGEFTSTGSVNVFPSSLAEEGQGDGNQYLYSPMNGGLRGLK